MWPTDYRRCEQRRQNKTQKRGKAYRRARQYVRRRDTTAPTLVGGSVSLLDKTVAVPEACSPCLVVKVSLLVREITSTTTRNNTSGARSHLEVACGCQYYTALTTVRQVSKSKRLVALQSLPRAFNGTYEQTRNNEMALLLAKMFFGSLTAIRRRLPPG